METPDVGILYCEDGAEWSECLTSSIETNFPNLHVCSQALEDLVLPLTSAKQGYFLRIKSQIVIFSPSLLAYMQDNPEVILGKLFDRTRVLAFLCGVEESEFLAIHRANLLNFETWEKVIVTDSHEDDVMHKHITDALKWTFEVLSQSEPAEPRKKTKAGFKLHPSKVREGASKVIIEALEPMAERQTLNVTVETDTESIPLKVVLRNPYMAKFVLPDRFFDVSQIVNITVNCGAKSLGSQPLKCESKMAEMDRLLHTILHPLSFMCQTLGLAESRIEDLDHHLTKLVKINIPKCGFSVMDLSSHINRQRVDEELPTLLHFSSKMGLKELSAVLLDCPGGEAACRLRNARGHTPADLAESEGHSSLAGLLESFSSMSETAEIYTYMQHLTEEVHNKNYVNLCTPFRQSLDLEFNPCFTNAEDEGALGGEALPSSSYTNSEHHEQLTTSPQPHSQKGANLHLYGQSQQELIQLLEDFKEEKYDIEQVEVLFKSWQQKQYSRSFYEKQKQLKDLREQYEKIQTQCHGTNRKKSALERFKSMVRGNCKKEETVSTPIKAKAVYKREKSTDNDGPLPELRFNRPSSTWSCGSTSSSLSDRSSTMSGTSDSGTLSDIGEEKRPSGSLTFENKQYMYEAKPHPPLPSKKPARIVGTLVLPTTIASTPRPIPPKLITPKTASPKAASPKMATKKSISPKLTRQLPSLPAVKPAVSTQISIRDRKPMPPPRLPSTLQSLPSLTLTLCPDSNGEDLEESRRTAVAPIPQNSRGYLVMDSQRPVPGRRPSAPSNMTSFAMEADYYNQVAGEPTGDYMVMDSGSPVDANGSQPAMLASNKRLEPYANMMCAQGNLTDFDDRCDSVPEMMAPPPPTTQARPRPPALPPRNLEKY